MSFARLTGLRLGLNRSSAIGRPHATRATSIRFASTSGTSEKSASPSLRPNGILALSLLAGAAATYYYDRYVRVSTTTTHTPGGTPVETSAHGPTFEVSIRSSRGPVSNNFRRLPERDMRRRRNSTPTSQARWWMAGESGGALGSELGGIDEPCEDRSAIDIVPRSHSLGDTQRWWKWNWGGVGASAAAEASTPGSKGIMSSRCWTGMRATRRARLLSKTLHPTLTLALAGLQAGISPTLGISKWSQLASYLDPAQWLPGGIWTPENVSRTIQSA